MNALEQLGRGTFCCKNRSRTTRRYMKRLTAKARRRQFKLQGEDAPVKGWKGWVF